MDFIKNFLKTRRSISIIPTRYKAKESMATHSVQDKAAVNPKQIKIKSQITNEIKDIFESTQEPHTFISKTTQDQIGNEIQNKGTEKEEVNDCLKEFNEILEEVSKNVKELPLLDDIDDIINDLSEEGEINELVQRNVDFEDLLPQFQINPHNIDNQTPKIADGQQLIKEQDEQEKYNEGHKQEMNESNEHKQLEIDYGHLAVNEKHDKDNKRGSNESDNASKNKTDENIDEHKNNEMTVIQNSDDSQEVIVVDFQDPLEVDVISISSEDSHDNAQNIADVNVIDAAANKDAELQNVCNEGNKIQDCEDECTEIDEKSDEPNKNVELKDNIDDNKGNSSISDDDCGYHSSDFEFIAEDEAKMDGLIINYIAKNAKVVVKKPTQVKTIEITVDGIVGDGNNNSGANIHPSQNPGPSTPNSNNLRWYQRQPFVFDDSYRLNHRRVDRDNYHTLFNGNANPIPTRSMRSLENKSVRCRRKALVAYQGVGFDMQLFKRWSDNEDDETKEEARKSAKKILEMYSTENRKRRRI